MSEFRDMIYAMAPLLPAIGSLALLYLDVSIPGYIIRHSWNEPCPYVYNIQAP
jgi:hypothetical protein